MIRTIRDPATEALFQRDPRSSLPPGIREIALRKLAMLNSAIKLSDLRAVPGNRIETLSGGSHKGYHRLPLKEGWHLYFWWMDGDAYKVAIQHEETTRG